VFEGLLFRTSTNGNVASGHIIHLSRRKISAVVGDQNAKARRREGRLVDRKVCALGTTAYAMADVGGLYLWPQKAQNKLAFSE
jgi:hypothetical protein